MQDGYWKGKKILITGGTSFVGKNLTRKLGELEAEYFTFGSKNFDLTVPQQANTLMEKDKSKYDFIIHMAALQHAADWPMYHTGEQFHVNSMIHINTLEAWRKFQPQAKFVAVGSSCCYPGEIPKLREEDFDNGEMHPSVYAYGITKKLLKVGLQAYKNQYRLRGTFPIFATLYGPHDDFDLKTAHVVGALVAKFCNAKKADKPEVEIWGDGTQTRELIYIEDQLDGLLMATENYDGDIINIGSGIETTIKDLAETIKKVSDYKGKIVYNLDRFVGVKNKVLDVSKARKEFGWTTANRMHTLEEGLAKTVAWYNKNYKL